jgi:hypothetical protein
VNAARQSQGRAFWLAVAVSLAISFTPWATIVLYPFKLLTTWIHECSHALMTVIVGGRVMSIVLEPDTSGLTRSLVPPAGVARGLIASAGYLGAACAGCLLLTATRVDRWSKSILWTIIILLVATLVLWMRNLFGIIVVSVWTCTLIVFVRGASRGAIRFVLSFLAIQIALNAVFDIRVLFLIDGGPSDAATMSRLFALPSWVWAASWMAASIAMLMATLRATQFR